MSLGSAPIPGVESTSDSLSPAIDDLAEPELDTSMLDQELAEIAGIESKPEKAAKPKAAENKPASDEKVNVQPPKPPVDITLFDDPDEDAGKDDDDSDVNPDFEATMIIAPDPKPPISEKAAENSSDAFLDKVKGQIPDAEGKPKDLEEAFIQTTRI